MLYERTSAHLDASIKEINSTLVSFLDRIETRLESVSISSTIAIASKDALSRRARDVFAWKALSVYLCAIRNVSMRLNIATRRRKYRPSQTVVLREWLSAHSENPYPTKAERTALSETTKLTLRQVTTWFQNRRTRMRMTTCAVKKEAAKRNERAGSAFDGE